MPHTQWYYLDEAHQQVGPVGSSALRERVAKGLLKPKDMIWREGLEEWVEAGKVRGLFGANGAKTKPARSSPKSAAHPAAQAAPRSNGSDAPLSTDDEALPSADELEEVQESDGDGPSIFATAEEAKSDDTPEAAAVEEAPAESLEPAEASEPPARARPPAKPVPVAKVPEKPKRTAPKPEEVPVAEEGGSLVEAAPPAKKPVQNRGTAVSGGDLSQTPGRSPVPRPTSESPSEPATAVPPPEPKLTARPAPVLTQGGAPKPVDKTPYAPFWRRAAAIVIDGVVLAIPLYAVAAVVQVMGYPLVGQIVAGVAAWLYLTIMEASKVQGTAGKLALGIQVTDREGKRLSMGRSAKRQLGRLVSALPAGLGYLMPLFTPRRQTPHDLIAGTLVVRRPKAD